MKFVKITPDDNVGVALTALACGEEALGVTLNQWFGFYKNYFAKMRPAVEQEKPEEPTQPTEPAEGAEENAATVNVIKLMILLPVDTPDNPTSDPNLPTTKVSTAPYMA